jgi:hypothetical protein
LVALVTGALLVMGAGPAAAATPSAAAMATWQTNGPVYAVAYSNGTVYLGGAFTAVRPPGSSTTSVVRNNVAAFSASTGDLLPWDPNVDRTVRALAVGPTGTVYLGGQFSSVGGVQRFKLAAVDGSTGAATSWAPSPDALVRAIALSSDGSTVYAGGDFSTVGGAARARAAAISASTGALVSGWRADVGTTGTGFVNVTTLSIAGGTVYLGGTFDLVNGVTRVNTAAVSAATGAVTSWKANTPVTVLSIVNDGTRVFVGGRGTGGFLKAFGVSTGSQVWSAGTNGDVQALAVRGSELYVGGHFTTVLSLTRNHLAALDTATGTVLAWDPGMDGSVGAQALATDSGHLAAGGDFTFVGGRSQQDFAEFAG